MCGGGGSGGSIFVYMLWIYGDGEIDVFGGDGDFGNGGGGGVGCIFLYYWENYFLGCFFVIGGVSFYELGGLGIVFVENVLGMNVMYGYDCIDDVVYVERFFIDEEIINGMVWVWNRMLYVNVMGWIFCIFGVNFSYSYSDFS